jgi:D-alanyl-D-alanine dipeptidase
MNITKRFFLSAICAVLLGQSAPVFSAEQGPAPVPTAAHLTPADSLKVVAGNPDFTDLSTIPNVKINLKYATTDNFMGINLYGPFKTAYLHKVAAEKLKAAVEILKKEKPGWSFIVFDALRPRSVQWLMWDKVKDTPQHGYVANAQKGSVHNYGFALDISLQDDKGNELDMGTPFDAFSDLAQPKYEDKFLKEGKLTRKQIDNRLLLRHIMTRAGFAPIPNEWWHFDGLPHALLEKKFKMVE